MKLTPENVYCIYLSSLCVKEGKLSLEVPWSYEDDLASMLDCLTDAFFSEEGGLLRQGRYLNTGEFWTKSEEDVLKLIELGLAAGLVSKRIPETRYVVG